MQKLWQKSKCYDRMKKSDPAAPSSKYVDLITGLPSKHASILTQLRTGHVPLAKHLFRIGKADSPVCPACQQADETIQHYITLSSASSGKTKLVKQYGKKGCKHHKTLHNEKDTPGAIQICCRNWPMERNIWGTAGIEQRTGKRKGRMGMKKHER
jgi:zinc-binding in reverse transcriptase